jgi:sterol 3beta-glucosyltransferase
MAPSEDDLKKRVARKLTKRRKEGHQVTMVMPERFNVGDDEEEDCTAPKGNNPYMNQSMFGLIAAAASTADFNSRFDAESSEEDEPEETTPREEKSEPLPKTRRTPTASTTAGTTSKHRRKFSESKLLSSFSNLGRKGSKSKSSRKSSSSAEPKHEQPQEPDKPKPPAVQVTQPYARGEPVMSQMLAAKAELSQRPSFDMPRRSGERPDGGDSQSSLANRLMEIFEFDTAEEVIEGWTIFVFYVIFV